MAYLSAIHKPKCARCGKPATETLIGNRNQRYSDYCTPHSKVALRELQVREDREHAEFKYQQAASSQGENK